jgi:hypothetical protein
MEHTVAEQLQLASQQQPFSLASAVASGMQSCIVQRETQGTTLSAALVGET